MSDSEWLHDPAGLAALLPDGFALGVATSAFQIEGAIREDGRSPSTWDTFMAQRGRIVDGSSAAVATDHYHRLDEDLRSMRELGVDSYRFSLAWSRLQPDGRGGVNRSAVAFYDRLLDGLLGAGISPMATLLHWDVPEALQRAGGWLDRDTAYRLADYAYLAGETFGDRVESWVTIAAPATVMLNGYAIGVHAPGATLLFEALPATHHQLLGHGLAVEALRAADVRGGIGIANVHSPVEPASDRADDVLQAQVFDLLLNRIHADPILLGRYPSPPEELPSLLTAFAEVSDSDLATISAPLDFYGVDYFFPTRVRAGSGGSTSPAGDAPAMRSLPFSFAPWPEFARTGFDRPVAPEYLGVALRDLSSRYGDALPPVVITANGASRPDAVAPDGSVDDASRISFLADHLAAAVDSGVDVRGFHVWSLLDSWEWAAGFTQRFGLVHVDFATQTRTPKRSYVWLQRLLGAR